MQLLLVLLVTVITALVLPMQANSTEISAMVDATLAAQRSENVEAASDAIQGLEEGIADSERPIRSMAETREFLDSVRGCLICLCIPPPLRQLRMSRESFLCRHDL